MTTKSTVDDFLSQRTLAVVGVSRDPKKFGNTIYRELKAKGYRVLPVNPKMETFDGDRCYPSLAALPERPGGAVIVVPPAQTEAVVRDAAAAGVGRVWMQGGAESDAAVRFCQANGISEVHGECVLMFAKPQGFGHKAHRWVWGLLGKLPK
ncbi:MAG: CoA-binding protein [Chloroflexi bacterium]|nr:CoA-binding protein [Chloroflexota bacterium]